MSEEDALNLGRMMMHYCKLSAEGKRRAWRIFELILCDPSHQVLATMRLINSRIEGLRDALATAEENATDED